MTATALQDGGQRAQQPTHDEGFEHGDYSGFQYTVRAAIARCKWAPGDLLGEGGVGLGAVEVRAVLAAVPDALSLAVNVGPAWAAMEVGERVVEVQEGTILVRGATILAERALRTSRGRELLLIGTLRAYGIGALVARPRQLTLPPTLVIRVGGGSAFRLALDVRAQDPSE